MVTPASQPHPGRYLRTVGHLRPEQVVARVRLRTQQATLVHLPAARRLLGTEGPRSGRRRDRWTGWPEGFAPFDARVDADRPRAEDLAAGTLTLLGASRALGDPPDWQQAQAPRLWRYHLHYWDWAWSLAAHPERPWARATFARLYRSWSRDTWMGHGDAWSPYVASLRAWSWCGLAPPLVGGTRLEPAFVAELARHAAFLRLHLETDVGGNHLLKNLKALLGLAVAFGNSRAAERWTDRFRREISRQVLVDGGHVERAPAYHCQVLADLDDVIALLRAAGRPVPPDLHAAHSRMLRWLGHVLAPDGGVPLLNDGFPVHSRVVATLRPMPTVGSNAVPTAVPDTGQSGSPGDGLVLLPESGVAVLRSGHWHVLADVGQTCPDDLPAHAHADTLSFLLWYDGTPLLVDTGTSTYAAGPTRALERSTRAHNTVVVDGRDSTEVWGAFRAGRRARVNISEAMRLGAADGGPQLRLTAAHDGYRWLPGGPCHQRTWQLDPTGLRVDDQVTGRGRHRLEVMFHLAPGLEARLEGGRLLLAGLGGPAGNQTVALSTSDNGRWSIHDGYVAVGWGRSVPAVVASYLVVATLPVRLTTSISISRRPAGAPPSPSLPPPAAQVPGPASSPLARSARR
ncbi:heparinase II/III domain-containing protein [Frankia tisae]|uniref:heparinase II/III domain-containing protein n=1 Tax=Frankia tisae TaxID=2950104 RepID=UPI003FD6F584